MIIFTQLSVSISRYYNSDQNEKKKRKKKIIKTFYQRLFIKYCTMTKFCKSCKWENRGNTSLDILPRKSSLWDEPHYLAAHRSENQANHTTNRQPMTAALNCSSTNQGFISFSKKIERRGKKARSAAVQLLTRWFCRTKPSREAGQLLGFSLPSFKYCGWLCAHHMCVC